MTLADARLYLVSPARIAAGSIADLIPELAAAGVDLYQLREKDLEAGAILRVAEPILRACRDAGLPFIVNDRPDVAYALGADGVHLGQNDLPISAARAVLPSRVIGLSTHEQDQIDRAVALDPDYIAVGPVNETPTKPGRAGTGTGLVRYAAAHVQETPWFVTGGMNTRTVPEVLEAGGRRIVVVRAITDAREPPKAAAELRSLLDSVAL